MLRFCRCELLIDDNIPTAIGSRGSLLYGGAWTPNEVRQIRKSVAQTFGIDKAFIGMALVEGTYVDPAGELAFGSFVHPLVLEQGLSGRNYLTAKVDGTWVGLAPRLGSLEPHTLRITWPRF